MTHQKGGICFVALLVVQPSLADSDYSAHRLCAKFDATGLSSECKVRTFAVDVTIDMARSEARKLCTEVSKLMAQRGYSFLPTGKWQLRIFSPYSGDRPIAACAL